MKPLIVGSHVLRGEQKLTVVSIRPDPSQVVLEGERGEQFLWSIDEFNTGVAAGEFKLCGREMFTASSESDKRHLNANERKALDRNLELLQLTQLAIRDGKTWKLAHAAVAEYCCMKGIPCVAMRTLQRLVKKANQAPSSDQTFLAPRYYARGNRPHLTVEDQEFYYEVNEGIFEYFCKTDKFNYLAIVDLINTRLREFAIDTGREFRGISRRTVVRRIQRMSMKMQMNGRVSRNDFYQEMRTAIQRMHVERPYERVEIDATPLDIFVIDDDGVVIGKPTCFAAIDSASKACLGITLSISKASEDAVLKLLEFCFAPKGDAFSEKYELTNEWLAPAGIETIALDNAAEHHGGFVLSAMRYLNVTLDYPQAGKPQYRPYIERLFGTINTGIISELPGATKSQSKLVTKPLKKAMSEAKYTVKELEALVLRWISDVYMQRPTLSLQRRFGKRCSPAQAMSMLKKRYPILPPPDPEQFREACLHFRAKLSRLTKDGVWCDGEEFNSIELGDFYQEVGNGHKVQVRYYPLDCTSVTVVDPRDNQNLITAFNKTRNMPVMSFADAKAARRLNYMSDADRSAEPYHQAQSAIRREAHEKNKSKKVGTRNQAARKFEEADRAQSMHKPIPQDFIKNSEDSRHATLTAAPRRTKGRAE